jgi:hypothetical protein
LVASVDGMTVRWWLAFQGGLVEEIEVATRVELVELSTEELDLVAGAGTGTGKNTDIKGSNA